MKTIRPELQKAVALYYDGSGAPQITAKGVGTEALDIMKLAEQHNVPTCENPLLVDLLSRIELGETVPESLYIAVAHIIAFAYQIRSIHREQLFNSTAPNPSGTTIDPL